MTHHFLNHVFYLLWSGKHFFVNLIINGIKQRSADIFSEGPGSKYFTLYRSHKVSVTCSFFYNPLKMYNPLLARTIQKQMTEFGSSLPAPGIMYLLSVLTEKVLSLQAS